MLRFMLTAAIIAFSSPAFAGEDCTCKYKDYDVPEGQTICMQTPNGSKMATCSRVLNNTSWKFLEQSCPQAENSIKQSPAVLDHADLIHLADRKKG